MLYEELFKDYHPTEEDLKRQAELNREMDEAFGEPVGREVF